MTKIYPGDPRQRTEAMAGRLPLSVAIITKDEERNIAGCLSSVSFADDIVVVDSGSTDKTVKIAEKLGARVFTEPWKGYGAQKNSAIEKCRHAWVLIIDADERVPEESVPAIVKAIGEDRAQAYSFKRKNYLHGKWMRHSGYWPDSQIRLVDKGRGAFRAAIHERWETDGSVSELDACIDHYGFSGYSDMLKTLNDYSTISAREMHASGRRAGPLSPIVHGVGMFIKIYLIKKGFLDGMDGLVTALTKAGGAFFKYAKLIELEKADKR